MKININELRFDSNCIPPTHVHLKMEGPPYKTVLSALQNKSTISGDAPSEFEVCKAFSKHLPTFHNGAFGIPPLPHTFRLWPDPFHRGKSCFACYSEILKFALRVTHFHCPQLFLPRDFSHTLSSITIPRLRCCHMSIFSPRLAVRLV